ncbi:MAG: hypothetical protein HZB61_08170 [Nitrospirae bacterium]|nr:hypothetical protein [Nitrospirota bacterium]
MSIRTADDYAYDLLEKAKRFYGKGKNEFDENGKSAYYQSSIIFAVMCLETTINSIADELCIRDDFSLNEKSLLLEREISFDKGLFNLSRKLKMSRLIDKISFLLARFNARTDKSTDVWWGQLMEGINIRNALIHPKTIPTISPIQVENTILSVLKCIDVLYRAIYKRKYPHYNKKTVSTYDF